MLKNRTFGLITAFTCALWVFGCAAPATEGPITPTDTKETQDISSDADADEPEVSEPDAGEIAEVDATEDIEETEDDIDAGPQACDPPLKISPVMATTLTFHLINFTAQGGTGSYQFELTDNQSGGMIHTLSGAYLAGELEEVSDTIRVTDNGCIDSADAQVNVVSSMTIEPSQIDIAIMEQFQFETLGGSGAFAFEMLSSPSGGSVDATGVYTAGPNTAKDTVRITDIGTGEISDSHINVVDTAVLTPNPPTIFLPEQATFSIAISGGSGHFSAEITGDAVEYSNNIITAKQVGVAVLEVTDKFLGLKTQITATVVASQQAEFERGGDQCSDCGVISAPGDLNGDGFEDIVFANYESDVSGFQSGAVYVYRGTQNGIVTEPVQVISGIKRRDEFGRGMATGDVDGDGQVDLIAGARLADMGATDTGAIYIYKGVENGFFSETPMRVLAGIQNSDQMGLAVAVCDFNGDGRLDIAASAWLGEDRNKSPQPSNQGTIHIYLGHEDGFLDKPDGTIYGTLPNENGEWVDAPNLRLAWDMVAGDVNGDGLCDLVAQSNEYKAPTGGNNSGAVFVYKGVAPSELGPGGLAKFPSLAWAGLNPGDKNSHFGRHPAIGDINNDGKAEIILGQYTHETVLNKSDNQGAVRVFLGQDLPDTPPTELGQADDADWTVVGTNKQDQMGWRSAVGDADGDGLNDLLVGVWNRIGSKGGRPGAVLVYKGVTDELPDLIPILTYEGLANGDRFGNSMATLSDMNDDGHPDLFVFAGLDDSYGRDVGSPYFVRGVPVATEGEADGGEADGDPAEEAPPMDALAMPSEKSGSRFGESSDIVGDLTGDGLPDLVVGCPLCDDLINGSNSGKAFIYKGTETGFEASAAMEWQGFPGNSSQDYFGWSVSRAGDFNKDGVPDVAVVARYEDLGNHLKNSPYTIVDSCDSGYKGNRGAVLVFSGTNNGLPEPKQSFMFFGPQNYQILERVSGGMDVNGDGYDDLVLSSVNFDRSPANNVGGFIVVLGRDKDPDGKIQVQCQPDLWIRGLNANDALGRSVTRLGDIDGDSCDEFAVGANAEDLGKSNQGTVRVVFGWGANCTSAVPRVLVLSSGLSGAQAGMAIAGGEDVDGDQLPDLVVGGHALSLGGNTVGAAWIVTGAYLKSLAPEVLVDNAPPGQVYVLADPTAVGNFRVDGTAAGGQFGRGVALIPGLSGNGRAGIAVGAPLGNINGSDLSG
ncbi:MAG TPA: hypothetical protein EYN66_09005, partial [Myxococcales bacterium]|nr:hypothetical protein [Myxococcales bacterium]